MTWFVVRCDFLDGGVKLNSTVLVILLVCGVFAPLRCDRKINTDIIGDLVIL